MEWARILAFITGTVDQELLLRNEYLAAENRILKAQLEATVRRYYYDSYDQLRQHLAAFLDAYNFAKRLKTLKGLTPFESICKAWTNEPDRFKHEPIQLTSGLHT